MTNIGHTILCHLWSYRRIFVPGLTAAFMEKFYQHAESRRDRKKPRIFLDIDGTLGDFMGHAQRNGKIDSDGKIMFDKLDYEWWKTMPEFPGAKAFYDDASKLGATYFLTGPSLYPASYAGKAGWTEKFVPERGQSILEDLILMRADKKHTVSRRGRILVDDNAENIEDWNRAGGIGIHYTGSYVEALKQLNEAVEKIKLSPAKKLMKQVHRLPALR